MLSEKKTADSPLEVARGAKQQQGDKALKGVLACDTITRLSYPPTSKTPPNETATEAFHRHERITVNYFLDDSYQTARFLISESQVSLDGQQATLTSLWAIEIFGSEERPLKPQYHPYLRRHVQNQISLIEDLEIVSPEKLTANSITASSIHPELGELSAATFFRSRSSNPAFDQLREFLLSLNSPADPLRFEILRKGEAPTDRSARTFPVVASSVEVKPLRTDELQSFSLVAGKIVAQCIKLQIFDPNDIELWGDLTERLSKSLENASALASIDSIVALVEETARQKPDSLHLFQTKRQELLEFIDRVTDGVVAKESVGIDDVTF